MQRSTLKRFNKPAFKVAEKSRRLTWTNILKKAKRCRLLQDRKETHSEV